MRLSFLDLVAKFGKRLSDAQRIGRRPFSGPNYEVETDRQVGLELTEGFPSMPFPKIANGGIPHSFRNTQTKPSTSEIISAKMNPYETAEQTTAKPKSHR